MRESSVRGPAIDLSEFERRMRGEAPKAAAKADPLSELARLMQGEVAAPDPFSKILPDPRATRAVPPPPPPPQWDAPLRGSLDAAPPVAVEPHHYEAHQNYAQHEAYQDQAYLDPGHAGEQHYDSAYHGGAEASWPDDSEYLDYGAEDEAPQGAVGGIRRYLRPWHAVAAISVIAVGSIGWGFLHRVGGSKEIAIINAPDGPVKVKPSAETETQAPTDSAAAVLERKDPAPVKQVVTHQEQAIDPTVAPKTVALGNGPVDAPHEPPLGSRPRKVKTVTVRPDGSRVDEATVPPAVAKSANPAPVDPFQAKGATPKPESKTATTPAAKPKAPPKVAAAPPPAEADAAAAAATTETTSGGYAVQFGAANSEEEARALLKTVAAKYHVKPTFKPAKVGDKTVYRVRVAGVSKDSANAICNKVKASGGNCFVAGN
jgi:hypothetical protein